jgi:ABC-type glycerol-3-phosphate transport system substrate-binding protein
MEAMNECFKYNDNYYVAASETNFGVVYYNKDLFQAAGLEDPMALYEKGEWTWANFVRAAKKLTNKDEKKWGFATEFPYLFYGSNATSTLKLDKNGKYEMNMDDPAFVAALEMIQDGTYNSGWSGWEGNALSSFQTGTSAMLGSFTMYEGEIDSLHNIYPDLYPSMNYGVVPLPKGPNNPTGMNMVHSAGWAIGSGSDCPAHVGKLIDMMVDGHAAYQAEQNQKLPEAHVALYKEMRKNQFCVNTRDSAIGGGYELAGEVGSGTSVAQAIEKFKPEYAAKIKEVNGK